MSFSFCNVLFGQCSVFPIHNAHPVESYYAVQCHHFHPVYMFHEMYANCLVKNFHAKSCCTFFVSMVILNNVGLLLLIMFHIRNPLPHIAVHEIGAFAFGRFQQLETLAGKVVDGFPFGARYGRRAVPKRNNEWKEDWFSFPLPLTLNQTRAYSPPPASFDPEGYAQSPPDGVEAHLSAFFVFLFLRFLVACFGSTRNVLEVAAACLPSVRRLFRWISAACFEGS